MNRRCPLCGKTRPGVERGDWRCARCAADLGLTRKRERDAFVRLLLERERTLIRESEILDGSGAWYAARAAVEAAERVAALVHALEDARDE